jgi:hypothetical protein
MKPFPATTINPVQNMEQRKKDRRSYTRVPDFPLLTAKGVVREERRLLPDRRIRDIQPGRFKA